MDELQMLRTRCGEMAAEIERLDTVIREAQQVHDDWNFAFGSYIELLGGVDSNAWHDEPADNIFKAGYKAGLRVAQAAAIPGNHYVIDPYISDDMNYYITGDDINRLLSAAQKSEDEIDHVERTVRWAVDE